MKKTIIFIVVIVAAAGGIYFYKKEAKAPTTEMPEIQNQNIVPSASPTVAAQSNNSAPGQPANMPQATSGGGENSGSNIQVTEVDFDGTKFSPDPVTINVNDYIFFKNKSSGDFWPLAGSVDTMSAYPLFNAGSPIPAGGEYKFQFTKAGTFSYGDNLHANAAATIVVKP